MVPRNGVTLHARPCHPVRTPSSASSVLMTAMSNGHGFALLARVQAKWEPLRAAAPDEARRAVQDELDKLSGLEPASPEFNVTRT